MSKKNFELVTTSLIMRISRNQLDHYKVVIGPNNLNYFTRVSVHFFGSTRFKTAERRARDVHSTSASERVQFIILIMQVICYSCDEIYFNRIFDPDVDPVSNRVTDTAEFVRFQKLTNSATRRTSLKFLFFCKV